MSSSEFPANFLTYTRFASVLVRMECLKVASVPHDWFLWSWNTNYLNCGKGCFPVANRDKSVTSSVPGQVHDDYRWDIRTTPHMALGHSVMIVRMSLVLKASTAQIVLARLNDCTVQNALYRTTWKTGIWIHTGWYTVLCAKTCVFLAGLA